MGYDGERINTYSSAVIDGNKWKSIIYVGDSIVRKMHTRLDNAEDFAVCLARIEHVSAPIYMVHIGTNNVDKEDTRMIFFWEIKESTQKDEASEVV